MIVFCVYHFVLHELLAQDINDIRYVPIGDSYTIGTGAKQVVCQTALLSTSSSTLSFAPNAAAIFF